MKNFFTAVIFAVVALSFSAGSAEPTPVPLSESSAEEIYSRLESAVANDEILFTVKNFRRDSGNDASEVRAWTCDMVEKSTGKSDAQIFFTNDEKDRLFLVFFLCNTKNIPESELDDVVLMMITLSLGIPTYFGVPESECQALIEEFMKDPSVGKWSRWDSEHKKLVNIVAGNKDDVLGFYIYATDGED